MWKLRHIQKRAQLSSPSSSFIYLVIIVDYVITVDCVITVDYITTVNYVITVDYVIEVRNLYNDPLNLELTNCI